MFFLGGLHGASYREVGRCRRCRVYQVHALSKPRDHNLILGSWQHGVSHQGVASIGMSVLGTPVKDDYKRAYNEAVQYGVPFLWVDDPAGLFPPADRPTPP